MNFRFFKILGLVVSLAFHSSLWADNSIKGIESSHLNKFSQRQEWLNTAAIASKNKQYGLCAQAFIRAAHSEKKRMRHATDLYNAACCYALEKKEPEKAFRFLEEAILINPLVIVDVEQDSDLAELQTHALWPDFKKLLDHSWAQFTKKQHQKIFALYKEDQQDRQKINTLPDWKNWLQKRDLVRITEVKNILLSKNINLSAFDYFFVAMLFQHGTTLEDIKNALFYSKKATEMKDNFDPAKWLVAASEDRLLMMQKKPQKYGTQIIQENGVYKLYQYDKLTTDQERDEMNVDFIEVLNNKVSGMNAK